jgi:DNA-binding NarL/FixJ family response regulator
MNAAVGVHVMAPRRAAAGLAAAQMVQLMAESAPPSDAALTHGETRVLHCLPTNLSAREIAGELYLSVNTVKTQQHLYQNSARAAVPRPSSRPAPSACSHYSSRRRR